MERSTRSLYTVLLVCLVVRLTLFFVVMPWDDVVASKVISFNDAPEYHELGSTLVQYHQFARHPDAIPDGLRTPVYPLLVALSYGIFGQHPWVILLFQVLLDSLTCVLLFVMVRDALDPQAAFYASLFYALDPFLIFYSLTLLSDSVFVCACVASAFFFSKALSSRFEGGWRDIILSAILFGLAALIKPVAQFIVFPVLLVVIVTLRKRIGTAMKFSAAFIAVFLFVISPWLIRNWVTFGAVSLSYVGEKDIPVLYVTPMEMDRRGQPESVVRAALLAEADSLMARDGLSPATANGFQKRKYWRSVGFNYIATNPGSFLRHYALGMFHLLVNLGTQDYVYLVSRREHQTHGTFDIKAYSNVIDLVQQWFAQKSPSERAIGIFNACFLFVTYCLALIGVIASRRLANKPFLLFCGVIALYFILISGTSGLARYRLPAIPFYLTFVGIGVSTIMIGIRTRRRK